MSNRFRDFYRAGQGPPLVLAHRGASAVSPENTIEAASLGYRAGASGWELDVRATRDGVLVLLHDESLARTTDVARKFCDDPRAASGYLVADFDRDEVLTLDAASWFLDPEGGYRSAAYFGTLDQVDRGALAPDSIRIPTLADALGLTKDLDWLVNVEVKSAPAGAVVAAIRQTGTASRVAVSSFDHAIIAEVARLEPNVATGALFDLDFSGRPAARLAAIGADALHISVGGFEALGEEARSVPILVYTVNEAGSPGLAARLAEAGVAGLFTDDPASLRFRVDFSRSSGRTKPRWGPAGHARADR